MEFTTIYRNGKPQYFFIKIDEPAEFNFIQPYFLVTSIDKPRTILYDYSKPFETRRDELRNLLNEFVKEVTK